MTPCSQLDRRESQARHFHRHRIHPDLRVDDDIELCTENGFNQMTKSLRRVHEIIRSRPRKGSLLILHPSGMKHVQRKPIAIKMPTPALRNGGPDRLIADVRRDNPYADRAAAHASGSFESLLVLPKLHQANT